MAKRGDRGWADEAVHVGPDGSFAKGVADSAAPNLISIPSRATFVRPANTTDYEPFDLVANSVTAGSVAALSWTGATIGGAGGSGVISRATLIKGGTAAARFRLHFFKIAPTVDNGDGGILVVNNVASDNYIGCTPEFEVMGGVLKIGGIGGAVGAVDCNIGYSLASGDTIYGLLETTSAWTPVSGASLAVLLDLRRAA